MRGVNLVILLGNLGQDPELRYTGSGTAVANLRLATNQSYRNSDGELVEKTEWHNVVVWDRLAEIVSEYATKGTGLHVTGSLQTRSWEDRDGNTRYTTEVKAQSIEILNGGSQNTSEGSARTEPANTDAGADDLPFS